jgi:hypothetical protein
LNSDQDLKLYLLHNFFFYDSGFKNKRRIAIKSFLFLMLVLSFFFEDYTVKFKKRKKSKINILNAPYKNKLAQRQFTMCRYYFYIKITPSIPNEVSSAECFFDKVNRFNAIGSLFFYLVSLKIKIISE